jgi:hypothetical protein
VFSRAIGQYPLPSPEEVNEIKALFRNNLFLRSLRKIAEVGYALKSGQEAHPNSDMIYAQTVIQLDGDVINRFHVDLLDPEQEKVRDLYSMSMIKRWLLEPINGET